MDQIVCKCFLLSEIEIKIFCLGQVYFLSTTSVCTSKREVEFKFRYVLEIRIDSGLGRAMQRRLVRPIKTKTSKQLELCHKGACVALVLDP